MHGLARVESIWWTDEMVLVESSRDPFMPPLGHVPCKALGGGETEGREIHFADLLQGGCRSWVVNKILAQVARVRMSW